ncbi:tetratricopeptide repeat-containing sensor histidine kinase [Aquimarina brevivitae]|uniref:Histidine kinase n=1 Tax=Aquimarina brevivitae TaxID=323412 RepID=A0A4Q7P2A1_9FLAO|nr:tetratricopeptide repeat protein [Aquimarina brevivitae]RZS93510.1 histidine kinase [Aquimarina brevivitae]
MSLRYICWRKLFVFDFILLILFSCNTNQTDADNAILQNDNFQSYLIIGKDSNYDKETRYNALDKAYKSLNTFDNDSLKVRSLSKLALAFNAIGEEEHYEKLNRKSLKLSEEINDSLGMARAYDNLGVYYRKKKLDSAYQFYYKADGIYQKLEKSQKYQKDSLAFEHGRVLIDLAKISRTVKDYSESDDLTIRAIQKFEQSGNERYIPMCYTSLGIIAKYMGRFEESIDYHKRAIESAKNTDKEKQYAVTGFNNIGTVYKTIGQFDKAKDYYKKGLEYQDYLLEKPKTKARLLDNLAYVKFLENSEDKDVVDILLNSLKIREENNDVFGIGTNTLHLAEYYHKKGQDSLAKMYAIRAKNASENINNNEELLSSYKLLTEVSDSKEGLEYARSYIKLNDSIVNDERTFRDKFARIKFETDELEQEKAEISKENEFLVIAVLGLTALFLLVYIIFRQQQSNKELLFAQAQQESNEEIYRLLLNQQVKLEEGRQLEQQRMSEELHDGVLGRLFGVRLSLDGINQRANDGFTEARNKYIEELKSIEKEIRLISHDLGTDTLTPDVAYIDVVESLISDLCHAHKMEFEFSNDENIDWEEVEDQKKVNLLRILQESLQNIFKHANATEVKISFGYEDGKINLTILDNGVGFKSTKVKRGIGLKNITNRVRQMSGVVDFISNQGDGTKVDVSVPM